MSYYGWGNNGTKAKASKMKYYIAISFTILLTSLSQILLKLAADKKESFAHNIFKFITLVSYFLFFVATLLSVFALQKIDLKMVTSLGSITIMLTVFSANVFLKERIHTTQLLGVVLIATGVFVFSF